MFETLQTEDLVLVMAPIGADAINIARLLSKLQVNTCICSTDTVLQRHVEAGCAALILTDEALTKSLYNRLCALFVRQPAWSDIPLVLITSGGSYDAGHNGGARLLGPGRTVTILERPLRFATLAATLKTVLSARRRQYEIRDLLRERDTLLGTLETRVVERTADLRRMVEEMEAFSYSVSHDLRSPLRSLAGYAEVLQEDYSAELSAGAKDYLQRIVRSAKRMDTLTQDILAYTRMSRGEMQIVPVDLDGLIADIIEQYPTIGHCREYIHITERLGTVMGHPPSLIQCFSNLLGNALKFVPEDRTPIIEILAEPAGDKTLILIKDNGIGVDPAHHDRIFRMFERAAVKEFPGTGIGLAIVKKAVERMGGRVGITSRPAEGSVFWIELPSAHPAASAETELTPMDQLTSATR